jgi:hypothetical protein
VKPQLISTDLSGSHNSDLKQSRARVLRNGSWKRQRVIMVIPAGDMIPAAAALSHMSLAFPPNNGVVRILAQGMEVGEAYSNAIEQILANPDLSQWEYLLTVEHDNIIPADGVIKLIERMEANPWLTVCSGLYWLKGPGGEAHIWGSPKDDPIVNYRPQPPDPNGALIETYGTSMGFALWRLSMFRDERLKRPWFKTLNGKDGQGIGTQDLQFFNDARKYGYRCGVDCSVKVGHIDYDGSFGPKGFVW